MVWLDAKQNSKITCLEKNVTCMWNQQCLSFDTYKNVHAKYQAHSSSLLTMNLNIKLDQMLTIEKWPLSIHKLALMALQILTSYNFYPIGMIEYLKCFDESFDILVIPIRQNLLAYWICLLLLVAVWTDVGIHVIGLYLGHAHTPPVEPILASVTANVEPTTQKCAWLTDVDTPIHRPWNQSWHLSQPM